MLAPPFRRRSGIAALIAVFYSGKKNFSNEFRPSRAIIGAGGFFMNEDAAKKFAPEWNGRGDEESDYQIFWLTLLRDVFGVDKPERLFRFQVNVRINDQSKFIDALVPRTKVLIEQKSFGVDKFSVGGVKAKDQPRAEFVERIFVAFDAGALVIFFEGVVNDSEQFGSVT